jgi:transcriptional regulator with XRE-family HTH domain
VAFTLTPTGDIGADIECGLHLLCPAVLVYRRKSENGYGGDPRSVPFDGPFGEGRGVTLMHPGVRAQIRSARMSNGLSLRELGRRTGVTASLLSQIENGKSDPSVSTLTSLVAELGLSLDALLRPDWTTAMDDLTMDGVDGLDAMDSLEPRLGRSARESHPVRSSPVIHPAERQTLDLDSGVVWERLTRGPSEVMDALLVTYQPGATSSSGGKLLRHSGIERAYLIAGELTLQLGFDTYRLGVGDSLEFDAATPHVYCNPGDVPARGLWFVLGKENLPARTGTHRLLDLADAGVRGMAAPADFLRAFSSE